MPSGALKHRLGCAAASALLASLCAVVVTALTAHAAQEEEGIALGDIRPLAMTWKEARRNVGVASTLCNVGNGRAMRLNPRLEGFNFTRGDRPVRGKVLQLLDEDLRVLERSPKLDAGLGAGDCLVIVVRVIPGTPIVDPGPFTGVLTVSSAGSGLARRELSLSGSAKAETVATKTAPKSPTLHATSDAPWEDAHLDDPPELALLGKVPPSAIAGTCGEDSETGDASADKDVTCPVIGVLVKDQERAKLRVGGPLKDRVEEEGVTLLPLELEGAGQVGVYEGVLDLAGTGKDADAVAVKVEVTDSIWCALLALAAGVLLALIPQLCIRRRRPSRAMREEADRLRPDYATAKEAFNKHVVRHPALRDFRQPVGKADGYAAQLNTALERYRRTTVFVDTASESWKKLKESLQQARADIRCWEAKDGLAKALLDLRDALTKMRNPMVAVGFGDQTPALANTAAKLLKPPAPDPELGVGEAIERAKQATDLTPVLERWQELAEQLLGYRRWWHRLRARQDDMEDADRAILFDAGARLIDAKHALTEAEDAEALERVVNERELASAHHQLAYLRLRYSDGEELDAMEAAGAEDALWPGGGEVPTLEQMVERSGAWIVDAARALSLRKNWGIVTDVVWILLVAAAAVITALSAFWIDKEWGTLVDYLTLILVGAVAQALVKTVIDTINQVLQSRASVLEAEPEPAKSVAA